MQILCQCLFSQVLPSNSSQEHSIALFACFKCLFGQRLASRVNCCTTDQLFRKLKLLVFELACGLEGIQSNFRYFWADAVSG